VERTLPPLREGEVDPDPLAQFRVWLDEEVRAGLRLPAPMLLGTATPAGRPSARTVLLNGFDAQGFAFFTNYESRKGRELAENPRAVLLFVWAGHARQVCIEGPIAKLSAAESDEYFRGRPRDSQLGAWASRQSAVISSREVLDERVRQLAEQFRGLAIPRPPYWGGFRLDPEAIEFWQGRPDRLHDRLRYRRLEGRWYIERLSP
jgi:pyridoxamine 5'-phosphate oxidase